MISKIKNDLYKISSFLSEIEPEENIFITFPSSELYTHKVEKVTSGMRYTCPGFWAIKE